MCKWGTNTILLLPRASGSLESVGIDSCIASIVEALNKSGIRTIASCCGHGKIDGSIILADGRELLVRDDPYKQKKE